MPGESRNAVAGPSKRRPGSAKKNGKRPPLKSNKLRKLTEKQKLDNLDKAAIDFEPPADLKLFADLPISDFTKRGLKKASFVEMTDIQCQSIPQSLKGKDVLGAARTGSGKTLAFLIPVLEILHRRRWGPSDGLGALIISPTRELAVQIFEVLRSIGGYHNFSAGLVIGGKDLKGERDRLSRMNILVATPGRILQHMDQTVGFDADNLQILVLDEADRILDMGFQRTLTALLNHLPKSRQTLLFSATQTQTVSDLARLSLKDPAQIGLPGTATSSPSMPQNLEQHYLVVDLPRKLDILWSFIKTHLQSKVIVFLSSCKQVRFVFETFCKMHPGIPLMHLHGKQKQTARLTVYQKFISMSHAVLFATDIAARGLDFPSVDWVLQVDAPEDAETYIHRVGRTARYESKGKALLFLLPSEEEGMKAALDKKGLQVSKIKNRESKMQSVQNQLQSLCFQDPEIKYLGQRAFVSYLRSIYVQKDKSIFKLEELPIDVYAESLGLPGTPKIKFLRKEVAKAKKNAPRAPDTEQYSDEDQNGEAGSDGESDESGSEVEGDADKEKSTKAKPAVRTKYDRMFERKNQNVLSAHYSKLVDGGRANDADDDDLFTLARADHDLSDIDHPAASHDMAADLSKRKQKLGRAKKAIATGGLSHKLIFDDEGKPHELYELADAEEFYKDKGGVEGVKEQGKLYVMEESKRMREADVVDKQEAREKKREKKRKRKEKEAAMLAARNGGAVAEAPSDFEDDGYESPEFNLPPASDDDDSDGDDERPPPSKRARTSFGKSSKNNARSSMEQDSLEEEEELALRLLGRT